MTDAVDDSGLLAAVRTLRDAVEQAALPLDLPGAESARSSRASLLKQLDDYVLPRLEALDAPLLAVVGGSTGAGKSTLVNSLVRRDGHAAAVCCGRPPARPCWSTTPPTPAGSAGPGSCPGWPAAPAPRRSGQRGRPVGRAAGGLPALHPGLALLDAPDIDSVVRANRDARHPAARPPPTCGCSSPPPPATPTRCRGTCCARRAARGTSVAIVLDRVPPEAMEEIRSHLASMLREQGLAGAPLFTVPETVLDAEGRLPRRGRRAPAVVAGGPGPRREGARHRHTAHPDRRPGLPVRAGGGPRRGQRGAGPGGRGAVGRGWLRRTPPRRRPSRRA